METRNDDKLFDSINNRNSEYRKNCRLNKTILSVSWFIFASLLFSILVFNHVVSSQYDTESIANKNCTKQLNNVSKFDYTFRKKLFAKNWQAGKSGHNSVDYVATLNSETAVVGVVVRTTATCRYYIATHIADVVIK